MGIEVNVTEYNTAYKHANYQTQTTLSCGKILLLVIVTSEYSITLGFLQM